QSQHEVFVVHELLQASDLPGLLLDCRPCVVRGLVRLSHGHSPRGPYSMLGPSTATLATLSVAPHEAVEAADGRQPDEVAVVDKTLGTLCMIQRRDERQDELRAALAGRPRAE